MSQIPHTTPHSARAREPLEREERIAKLTEELENLKRNLPAHSIKPAMLLRIEELEEEIESLK